MFIRVASRALQVHTGAIHRSNKPHFIPGGSLWCGNIPELLTPGLHWQKLCRQISVQRQKIDLFSRNLDINFDTSSCIRPVYLCFCLSCFSSENETMEPTYSTSVDLRACWQLAVDQFSPPQHLSLPLSLTGNIKQFQHKTYSNTKILKQTTHVKLYWC